MQPHSSYSEIQNQDEIKNDFLKPLHRYAQKIVPKPEQIDNRLIQKVYAESIIHFGNRDRISMVSRTAIQQYKKMSFSSYIPPDNCFKTLFAFYVAWWPDIDKDVIIKNTILDSPFYIPENIVVNFKEKYQEPRIELDPVWVPFFVKKESSAIKSEYGKILLTDIAYEIEI